MNSNALDDSRRAYHNGYYVKKLEEGLEFQDVATTALYQRGIVVVAYSSRRWQNERGENMLGAEIKRDGKFRQTGNLYIETAEKSHPDNPAYVPSGIMRSDNSWLYVIGDEKSALRLSAPGALSTRHLLSGTRCGTTSAITTASAMSCCWYAPAEVAPLTTPGFMTVFKR